MPHMQNITLICETLMLESIKHTHVSLTLQLQSMIPVFLSLLTQFSRLYTLVSSLHYRFLHLVIFLTGISGSISRASQWSQKENQPTRPGLGFAFLRTVSQQVVKAGYIPSPDITVVSVYAFITTIFIYKDVHVSALPRSLCSAALWSN